MSMHRTPPLTFTSCAHAAVSKISPTEHRCVISALGIKRALTAIQVISRDSGAGKMVSNFIAVGNEIENEGNRRGSVHVGADEEKGRHMDLDVNM